MFPIFWLLLFSEFRYISCQMTMNPQDKGRTLPYREDDDRTKMTDMMVQLTKDFILNQNEKFYLISDARQDNYVSAAFEIGYMTQMIQEHYRRMLDKWRNVRMDIRQFYTIEVVLYLEEIEHLYWSIKHEVYMLHEIERKYQIKSRLNESYEDPVFVTVKPVQKIRPLPNRYKLKTKPFNPKKFMANALKQQGKHFDDDTPLDLNSLLSSSRRPRTTRLPFDYGWELYEWNSDT